MSEKDKQPFKQFAEQFDPVLRSRVRRKIANTAIKTGLYSFIVYKCLTDVQFRRQFLDSEWREFIFKREPKIGLLEDSIIGNNLYVPNNEESTLMLTQAPGGRYTAFDFHRPEEFGQKIKEKGRQRQTGMIITFPLPTIMDNPPDKYTPTYTLNLFSLEHILHVDHPTLKDLETYGFVEQTSYGEAYQRVGLYKKYEKPLKIFGIADDPILRITPKGNGLVVLLPEDGSKSTNPVFQGLFRPTEI